MTDAADFARLTGPFRAELLAHCYRMLGSVHDAEDQVQEALIRALQYLPARQRATLILRDVLQWQASEVADLLGTSTTAVNGLLLRARARLEQAAPVQDDIREPAEPQQRALLDKYAAAFEN